MTTPVSRSIVANMIDEEGEQIVIYKDTVAYGLSRARQEAREARELSRRHSIEEIRRAASAAGAAAEAADYWWEVAHETPTIVVGGDADLRVQADWSVREAQDHLSRVLARLDEAEAVLAAQAAADEAALAERERDVLDLALLAEGAILSEPAFLAAYREGRLTNAQWAVMALRVGAGQASPEVSALVEAEASNAAQWAFLLR